MSDGVFRMQGSVLPIRQEMNGDEIDLGGDFPVAHPEFPDLGVGNRNIHAALDRADDFPKVGYDHLPAQQDFTADDDRGDRPGMIPDQRDRGVCEKNILRTIASDPDTEQDLQSDLRREFGHLVQSIVDGIGTDAPGYPGQLDQIFGDLIRADHQVRIVRRLIVPKGCIRNAFQFRCGINRRADQGYRQGQPPPRSCDGAKGNEEERQWRAQGDGPYGLRDVTGICSIWL